MAFVLTINGSTVNRVTTRVQLQRLSLSIDEYSTLEFSQVAATLPGTWDQGAPVAASLDGTPRFLGQIVHKSYRHGPDGWTIGYLCYGAKWLANLVPVTNPQDQSGTIVYNLPPSDPDFVSQNSGLAVGDMLTLIFNGHAVALAAQGIAGYVTADLTPLTIVPPEPVTIAGPHVLNAVDQLLERWSGLYACYVDWHAATSDWRIRVVDTTAFTPATLTLGVDPVLPPSVTADTSACYTRCIVRGQGLIYPYYASLGDGTLLPGWTSSDEASWKLADFTQPGNAVDSGSVTSLTSTSATVSTSLSYGTNYWSTNKAWIMLINPTATGITISEQRQVTANTATSGGSATISWDATMPLDNSGYTTYKLLGQPAGRSNVYRLMNVVNKNVGNTPGPTNPNPSYPAQHMVKEFPAPVPFNAVAQAEAMTNFPTGVLAWSSGGSPPYIEWPWSFEVLPDTYQIRFTQPYVQAFGTPSKLEAGNPGVDGIPQDIIVLLAYSRGALEAVVPPDVGGVPQYEGTAFTVSGIQRTWTIDVPTWKYQGDGQAASMAALAQMRLDTVKNIVYDFQLVYLGKFSTALDLGVALNVAGDNGSPFTTGWESINVPIRGYSIEWGAQGSIWRHTMHCNNRRKPATGDSLYIHPAFGMGTFGAQEGAFRADQFTAMQSAAFAHDLTSSANSGSLGRGAGDIFGGFLGAIDPSLPGMAGPGTDPLAGLTDNLANLLPSDAGAPLLGFGQDLGQTQPMSRAEQAAFNRAQQPGRTMRKRRAPELENVTGHMIGPFGQTTKDERDQERAEKDVAAQARTEEPPEPAPRQDPDQLAAQIRDQAAERAAQATPAGPGGPNAAARVAERQTREHAADANAGFRPILGVQPTPPPTNVPMPTLGPIAGEPEAPSAAEMNPMDLIPPAAPVGPNPKEDQP